MKVVITESRLEKVVTDYLDDVYIPDYGWSENNRYGSYQEDVDKFGDLVFFINDEVSYHLPHLPKPNRFSKYEDEEEELEYEEEEAGWVCVGVNTLVLC